MDDDDDEIIESPLQRTVTRDGMTVEICIYRGPNTNAWVLEIEDVTGGSTVWTEQFDTDHAALEAAMKAIETDGIESFMVEA